MNDYIVYMHISPSNKRYIGLTMQKPNERWRNGKGYLHNIHFTRAIEKYGWDNFQHITIAKGLTEEEAKWLEIELIKVRDTTNRSKGYNISPGGDIGVSPSEETRKKISEAQSGEKSCWYGRHHTEESKKKMSEAMKGEKNPNYGKHLSRETKQKLSQVKSGANNPNAKVVICITTKRIFLTIKEGGEYYNIKSYKHITSCCRGKLKSCGKYKGHKLVWKYLNHNHNKILRGKDISKLHK